MGIAAAQPEGLMRSLQHRPHRVAAAITQRLVLVESGVLAQDRPRERERFLLLPRAEENVGIPDPVGQESRIEE